MFSYPSGGRGGGGPGIFDWGGRRGQTMVQKGLLNFFCGKLLLAETTTCLSICEGQLPLAREVLLCKQRRTHHRRVPQKTNNIFEYPFYLNSASFMNTCGVD